MSVYCYSWTMAAVMIIHVSTIALTTFVNNGRLDFQGSIAQEEAVPVQHLWNAVISFVSGSRQSADHQPLMVFSHETHRDPCGPQALTVKRKNAIQRSRMFARSLCAELLWRNPLVVDCRVQTLTNSDLIFICLLHFVQLCLVLVLICLPETIPDS